MYFNAYSLVILISIYVMNEIALDYLVWMLFLINHLHVIAQFATLAVLRLVSLLHNQL